MPSTTGEGGVGVLDGAFEGADSAELKGEETCVYVSKDQLSEQMLTLSLVPKTKWQTLLHLDLIKVGNFSS